MRIKLYWSFLLVTMAIVVGCTTPVRLYDETKVTDKSVIVTLESESERGLGWFQTPVLHSVDGVEGNSEMYAGMTNRRSYNSTFDTSFSVELLPGKHTIVVTSVLSVARKTQWTIKPQTIEFIAEPGKKYVVKVKRTDSVMISEVAEKM